MTEDQNIWTATVEDAGDGTGDVIIPLPDDLLEKMGWTEDTVLNMTVTDEGSIVLRAAD